MPKRITEERMIFNSRLNLGCSLPSISPKLYHLARGFFGYNLGQRLSLGPQAFTYAPK
jgi:hypothetical protein